MKLKIMMPQERTAPIQIFFVELSTVFVRFQMIVHFRDQIWLHEPLIPVQIPIRLHISNKTSPKIPIGIKSGIRWQETIIFRKTLYNVVIPHDKRSGHWYGIDWNVGINVSRLQFLYTVNRRLPIVNECASLHNEQPLPLFTEQHVLRQCSGYSRNNLSISDILNQLRQGIFSG